MASIPLHSLSQVGNHLKLVFGPFPFVGDWTTATAIGTGTVMVDTGPIGGTLVLSTPGGGCSATGPFLQTLATVAANTHSSVSGSVAIAVNLALTSCQVVAVNGGVGAYATVALDLSTTGDLTYYGFGLTTGSVTVAGSPLAPSPGGICPQTHWDQPFNGVGSVTVEGTLLSFSPTGSHIPITNKTFSVVYQTCHSALSLGTNLTTVADYNAYFLSYPQDAWITPGAYSVGYDLHVSVFSSNTAGFFTTTLPAHQGMWALCGGKYQVDGAWSPTDLTTYYISYDPTDDPRWGPGTKGNDRGSWFSDLARYYLVGFTNGAGFPNFQQAPYGPGPTSARGGFAYLIGTKRFVPEGWTFAAGAGNGIPFGGIDPVYNFQLGGQTDNAEDYLGSSFVDPDCPQYAGISQDTTSFNGTLTLAGQPIAFSPIFLVQELVGGIWQNVPGAQLTLTDANGNTDTITTGALPGTYGALYPDDAAILSTVDWTEITTVVLTSSGTVGSPQSPISNGAKHPDFLMSAGGVPNFQKLPWVPGQNNCPNRPYFIAWRLGGGVVGQLTGQSLSVDAFRSTLAVSWVDVNHKLKLATHGAPQAYLGNAKQGWQTTQELESSAALTTDLFYLRSGRCFCNSDSFVNYSDKQGIGTVADWQRHVGGYYGAMTSLRSPHRNERWSGVFTQPASLFGTNAVGLIRFFDNDASAIPSTELVTAVLFNDFGPYAFGGADMGNQFGCAYTRNGDGHILWTRSNDGTTWPSLGVADRDTGLVGRLVDLVCVEKRWLVGLVWDWTNNWAGGPYSGTKQVKVVRARVPGTGAWEIDAGVLSKVPALEVPPRLVVLNGIVYAVWIDHDAPVFVASQDMGKTWT